MVEAFKTKEHLHQEDLERIAKYRPLDDDFMRELFRDNIPLTEMVLRIITGKKDLSVTHQETQYDMKQILEPVQYLFMCGFSSIILSLTRKKSAGILSYCKDF